VIQAILPSVIGAIGAKDFASITASASGKGRSFRVMVILGCSIVLSWPAATRVKKRERKKSRAGARLGHLQTYAVDRSNSKR